MSSPLATADAYFRCLLHEAATTAACESHVTAVELRHFLPAFLGLRGKRTNRLQAHEHGERL